MNKLKKYCIITKVSVINSVAYRANTIARFCFYTLFIYIFMKLWHAIYQNGNVYGYTSTQMSWYLIMTEFISFSCSSSIYNVMNDDVKSGAIAYQLGRPMHYVFFQFANSVGQIFMNAVSFGGFAILLGFIFAGPLYSFTLAELPALLLSIVLSISLNYFFLMLIGLSAFVMEENFAMYLIYQKLSFMLGMFLPVEFLPEWIQELAKHLPFSYVYWAPAKLFVNYSPKLAMELIPCQIIWTVVSIVLVLLSYRIMVRHLQVNGG